MPPMSYAHTAGGPAAQTSWPAVFAATLCGVAVAANVGKVAITLDLLRSHFQLDLLRAGWVSSAINSLAVSVALAFGMLGDRLGALRLCLSGLCVALLGGVAALFSTDYASLLASRIAEGAGYMAVAVSAPALLSAASTPRDRRFALGIWGAYMPAGIGLVMILTPLLTRLGGWHAVWLFTIALLAATAVGLLRFRAHYRIPPPAPDAAPILNSARQALGNPVPWLLAFSFACWSLQHFTLIVWLPTFLRDQRGLSPELVALLSCVMVLVNVPGNLLGGTLLQRNLPRGYLIAAASVVTGLSAVGVFSPGLPDALRYLCCLLVSFTGGLVPSSVLSSTASLARSPRQIGTLQGLFMQGANLGQFVGPPMIAAAVAARGDWQDAMALPVGAAIIAIGLGLAVHRLERRQQRAMPAPV